MNEPLTRGQQIFAATVARETGLDPRVVGAWAKSEQSGSAAQYYDNKNYHNYLNIANTDSGQKSGSHSSVWSDPETAGRATAEWIKGRGRIASEYGKPAAGISAILHTAGKSPQQQIEAIGNSGWATAPDYGQKIGALYHELSGRQLTLLSSASRRAGAAQGIAPVIPEASTAGTAVPPPPNPIDAITAIHTGAIEPGTDSDMIAKNWDLIKGLFDPAPPINQEHTGERPRIPLPGEETGNRMPVGAGAGHYVNGLKGFTFSRTDMGVDANAKPGTPIGAIGRAKVLGISPNWYAGQPYVYYELLDGPRRGQIIYVAEQITPEVQKGQEVQAGEKIGRYASSGTGIEIGLGTRTPGGTLAKATTGYNEGEVTKAGREMHGLLHELGAL